MKDNLSHSNINNHLRELNSGAGAKDNDNDKMEEDPLPRNNKSRESKKRENDKKNKEKERSQSLEPESSPSILKEGRFLATGKSANKAANTATKQTQYDHKNKIKVFKASIVLSGVDKYMEFTMGVRLFFTKLQVVDKHLVFEPVNPRNISLLKPADIPFCHTEMGEQIKVSGGKKSFKMKKLWRGDSNN